MTHMTLNQVNINVICLLPLEMFTTAYTLMEPCHWSACPETTNPVEHINKDSIPPRENKKTIWVVLDNLYRCDKLAAAKRVAVTSNVTINYSIRQDEARKETAARKRKWRRSLGKRGDADNPEGGLFQLTFCKVHVS